MHFAAWGRWDSNAGSQENAADLPAKASAAPAPKTAAKKSKGKKGRKKGRKQKRGNGNSNIVGLGANSDEDVTLVTASNDCSIRFWKLQPRAAAAQVEANKKKQTEQSARTEDADATPAETERPCKCELRVKHPRPINWIASTVAQVSIGIHGAVFFVSKYIVESLSTGCRMAVAAFLLQTCHPILVSTRCPDAFEHTVPVRKCHRTN